MNEADYSNLRELEAIRTDIGRERIWQHDVYLRDAYQQEGRIVINLFAKAGSQWTENQEGQLVELLQRGLLFAMREDYERFYDYSKK